MNLEITFILAGLSLFLFGMLKLTSKIQAVFSVGVRNYIKKLTKTPLFGVVLGFFATGIFQSSSAVTILIVGTVSAGLISFFNSLGLILGANLGTTITAQLVAFKVTDIAFLIIIAGLILFLVGKDKLKDIGEVIVYFGLLFFGLFLLNQGLEPLKQNDFFINLLSSVENPLMGLLIGALFTAIVQSSSATTSIIVILGLGGFINLSEAVPLILGASIGTTATAALASIGAPKSGKRVALSHALFNVFSVLLILPFLPTFISFIEGLGGDTGRQIANAHTLFKVLMVVVFIFFLKPFSVLIKKLIKGDEEVLPLWPEWLDKKLINQPSLALEAVAKELKREITLTQRIFLEAKEMALTPKHIIQKGFNLKIKLRKIYYLELVVDKLQSAIAAYLDSISKNKLSSQESKKLFQYSLLVDEIERLGDHAVNLAKLARWEAIRAAELSREAKEELKTIIDKTEDLIKETMILLNTFDQKRVEKIYEKRSEIVELISLSKQNHHRRFYQDIDIAAGGPIFIDMLVNLQGIARHCSHIARTLSN